jgi:hypothetical protein
MPKVVLVLLGVAAVAAGLAATLLSGGRVPPPGDPPRQVGPEWVRVGDEYHRTLQIQVVHPVGGNVNGYRVPLESDFVWITEPDEHTGFEFRHERYGEFRVSKDHQGQAREFSSG